MAPSLARVIKYRFPGYDRWKRWSQVQGQLSSARISTAGNGCDLRSSQNLQPEFSIFGGSRRFYGLIAEEQKLIITIWVF